MPKPANIHGTDEGNLTVGLPDCAKQLARLRPQYGTEAQFHISNLIEQCRNYPYNPEGLRPQILRTIERLSAFLKNDT